MQVRRFAFIGSRKAGGDIYGRLGKTDDMMIERLGRCVLTYAVTDSHHSEKRCCAHARIMKKA